MRSQPCRLVAGSAGLLLGLLGARAAGAAPVEAPAEAPSAQEEAGEEQGPVLEGAAPEAAVAPESAPRGEAAPAGPRLPSLLAPPVAAYPAAALDQGIEASVLLELDLDAEGRVLDARVVESAGAAHSFDTAARDALLTAQFSPALDRKGRPTPATLQYRYAFVVEAAPVVSAEGQVLKAGTRAPLAGIRVVASAQETGETRVSTVDAEGRFSFVDLAPGVWTLDAGAVGFDPERVALTVRDGAVATASLYLKSTRPWDEARADEVMVVEGARLASEVSERSLRADEIRMQPGSAGDVVRAIQSLPGMARPPFNAGQLLVRGTGPDDSGFYLAGLRIPLVFHFGGLATVINGDSLDTVLFLPGNYSVRYGRTLGGVVDLRLDPDLPDRSGGYAAVDLFQSSLFVQQTLKDRTAVTVSGRRSYIDGLLAPILNQQTSTTVQLPRYADVQARVQHRLANDHDLDVMFLVSDDRTSIDAEGETGPDASSFVVLSFLKAFARWRAPLSGGWVAEQSLLVGPENQELVIFAEDGAVSRGTTVAVRSELNRPVPEGGVVGWRVGIDASAQSQDFRYDFEESSAVVVFAAPEEGSAVALYPGAYLEQTQRAGNLEGVPGVRVDAMLLEDRSQGTRIQAFAVDPRLALRYRLSEATRVHGTVGRYSQFPQIRELLLDANGTPGLQPEWALATSVGVEQRLTPELSVEATAYQSWLYDVIVGREDRFEFQLGPLVTGPVDTGAYDNAGSGSITGLETLLRWEDSRTTAWLGLTVSRSLRRGRLTDEVVRFRYDQPVIATAVVSHALPRSWQLGARFRYGSGNPYYTVSNRSYSLDRRLWVPLFAETPSRLPAFWSLDLRVDKRVVFRTWALTTYLDLLNATNRRNQELVNWTADYTQEVPVYGLPIIPAFGVRGEW